MPPVEDRLAFDARVMWLEFATLWDARRQAQYLLRQNVSRVLSVDGSVWPSVFDEEAIGADMKRITIGGPDMPDYVGVDSPLWENLESLRDFVGKSDPRLVRPFWIVAFSGLGGSTNACVSDTWTFLGYDVADGAATSGLSNCGYTESDRAVVLSQGWQLDLNDFHLFSSVKAANEFREFSNSRVTEHSPFSVVGLYLVDEF